MKSGNHKGNCVLNLWDASLKNSENKKSLYLRYCQKCSDLFPCFLMTVKELSTFKSRQYFLLKVIVCLCYWHSFVDKRRRLCSKEPWMSFFLGVKHISHLLKNSVSRFMSSHYKSQMKVTITFIFCRQILWSPPRQPIKRLLNWNNPESEKNYLTHRFSCQNCLSFFTSVFSPLVPPFFCDI